MIGGNQRDFDCKATFDGVTDIQRYDLNRKTFNTKIFILPPSNVDMVPVGSAFSVLVQKDSHLNLTCYASVGCNDINYDIQFRTNTTDEYSVKMNVPDRSKCLLNFNEIANFTKSILIPRVAANASSFQCAITFGPDLKTESPIYYVYFAGF